MNPLLQLLSSDEQAAAARALKDSLCAAGTTAALRPYYMKTKRTHFRESFSRRRRDLNPRAAINDLHPFQGCPFSHLGYFSKYA